MVPLIMEEVTAKRPSSVLRSLRSASWQAMTWKELIERKKDVYMTVLRVVGVKARNVLRRKAKIELVRRGRAKVKSPMAQVFLPLLRTVEISIFTATMNMKSMQPKKASVSLTREPTRGDWCGRSLQRPPLNRRRGRDRGRKGRGWSSRQRSREGANGGNGRVGRGTTTPSQGPEGGGGCGCP
ncbi:Cation/H(+) antiporter 15 [Senna tora]|uniref:Cation/H(+) antiporter 15 n=1 Tax=Senna tora TaxID=362788 RepID=A0A834WWT9_9FABA|nr:Cation/H(+) antiporter 15 [Senna tora]